MRNKLDLLDARIIEGLGQYGPRNMTYLAKRLNAPRGTVVSRMRRMSSFFYLRMLANVYHTNIGLKKAVVCAKAAPGKEELLFNCMRVNGFYIYLSRFYGAFEGCLGIYVIPKEQLTKFKQFIQEIKELRVAEKIQLFWSTCFHTVNKTSNWFDRASENWTFAWDEWVKEISTQKTNLPYTLVDPEDFPMRADETDLFILKELEKDATIDLIDIAKKLGTTLQNVRHHYEKHVLKRGLIEVFQIFVMPFDQTTSDLFFFIFKFKNQERLAKFAGSLLDKPFVLSIGKILGESAIITQVHLPRAEFRNFVERLSKLAMEGYLQSYEYVIQDLRQGKWSRQTIPYEHFKDGFWVYDHKKHIQSLRDLTLTNKGNLVTAKGKF